MALTQCAIFYWTATGALALKLLLDDDSQYATIKAPPNRSFFLTSLVQNPKQAGCPDDDACRQLIAKQRGLPVVPQQFTAQIDPAGNVVVVHLDTDPSVSPTEVGAPKDHALAAAPAEAIIGDTFSGGAFFRRYVIADKTTNQVQSIATVQLGQPVSASPSQYATPSLTAQPGDTLPPQKTATATVTPTA